MGKNWILDFSFIIGIVLLMGGGNLFAQDSAGIQQAVVTKNYKFNDGIYFSFADFQKNSPVLRWDEMQGNVFSNPEAFTVKAEILKRKSPEMTENLLDSIWGFSMGGIPYIKIEQEKEAPLVLFAGMRVRGKLCYFTYEVREEKEIVFSAYNPVTYQPFRSSSEKRNMKVKKEKILLFETGKIMDYHYENMAVILGDDPTILRALNQIEDWEFEEKMFKCLLIYNDRHEVRTTASTPN